MSCIFSTPGANKLRAVAGICLLLAVMQLAFGATAHSVFSERGIGAWWCGLIIIICCVATGLKATHACCTVTAIILGIICVFVAFFAMVIDAVWTGHFKSLDGCAGDGNIYGKDSYGLADCSIAFQHEYSCVCVTDRECFGYDLVSGKTCDVLFDEVPANLTASSILAAFCCLSMIAYSVMACLITCCPNTFGHYDPSFAAAARVPTATTTSEPQLMQPQMQVLPQMQMQMQMQMQPQMQIQPQMQTMQQQVQVAHQVPTNQQQYWQQGQQPVMVQAELQHEPMWTKEQQNNYNY